MSLIETIIGKFLVLGLSVVMIMIMLIAYIGAYVSEL